MNEVLNHCEKNWPELKSVLKAVAGVEVHVYQGQVGNYEGPSIRKIFKKLESIKPHMEEGDKRLYYKTLLAFKQVSQSIFNKKIHHRWGEHLHTLRACMDRLNRSKSMTITPKYHVLIVHIEQWIDRHGRAMGNRDRPIYRFADIFGRYRYRYIGIGKLDIGIGLSVSVSVIG